MLITLNLQFFSLTSQMLLWTASQNQRLATARRAGCGFEVQRGRATLVMSLVLLILLFVQYPPAKGLQQ